MFFEDVQDVHSESVVTAPEIEIPAELAGPLAALEQEVSKLRTIRGLIQQARAAKDQAERDQQAAFQSLAAEEAAIILDGATANPALKKAALKHNENILGHDARIAGLTSRAEGARADVDAAMRGLSEALQDWNRVAVTAAQERFWAAVGQFVDAAAEPIAEGIGLADSRLSRLASIISIPDAEDAGRNAFQPIRGWKGSPRMMATVRRFGGVRQTVANAISDARLAVMNVAE